MKRWNKKVQPQASALALLELRVFLVDDVDLAFSSHHFAICRSLFNGSPDFHKLDLFNSVFFKMLFVTVNDAPPSQIVGGHFDRHFVAGKDADVVHAHFAGNCGDYHVVIFEANPEHCV